MILKFLFSVHMRQNIIGPSALKYLSTFIGLLRRKYETYKGGFKYIRSKILILFFFIPILIVYLLPFSSFFMVAHVYLLRFLV